MLSRLFHGKLKANKDLFRDNFGQQPCTKVLFLGQGWHLEEYL